MRQHHQPIVAGGIGLILLWIRMSVGAGGIPLAWLIFVLGLGGWWVIQGLGQWALKRREDTWPPVWGRVTRVTTELVPFPRAGVRPQARVHYEYTVGDSAFAGYADQLDTPVHANEEEVAAIRTLYRPGTRLELRYDPSAPEQSRPALAPRPGAMPLLLSGLSLVCGALVLMRW